MSILDGLTLAERALKAWDAFTNWLRKTAGKGKLEAAEDKADQTGDTSDLENTFRPPSDRK